MAEIHEWTCAPPDGGRRLDRFITERLPALSRSRIRRWIEIGAVHLNGRRTRVASRPVRPGAVVRLVLPAREPVIFTLRPERILFDRDGLLALDKPAGVQSQPTPYQYRGCVYEAVLRFLGRRGPASVAMPQRLDCPVSGVMVLSVRKALHRGLTEAFREHRVRKTYLAVCREGEGGEPPPEAGEIDRPIGRSAGGRRPSLRDRAETAPPNPMNSIRLRRVSPLIPGSPQKKSSAGRDPPGNSRLCPLIFRCFFNLTPDPCP